MRISHLVVVLVNFLSYDDARCATLLWWWIDPYYVDCAPLCSHGVLPRQLFAEIQR